MKLWHFLLKHLMTPVDPNLWKSQYDLNGSQAQIKTSNDIH